MSSDWKRSLTEVAGHLNVGESSVGSSLDHLGVGLDGVRLVHSDVVIAWAEGEKSVSVNVLERAVDLTSARVDLDANSTGRVGLEDSLERLLEELGPSLQVSSPLVGSVVAVDVQELDLEVAVGRVDLNTIESGSL